MPFAVIGAEWVCSLPNNTKNRGKEVDEVIRDARAVHSPENLADFLGRRRADLDHSWPFLLDFARSEIAAGRREVEWIGHVLISLGHLAAEAAGHFLIAYSSPPTSDPRPAHFERASAAYRELGRPLPAALSALAAELATFTPQKIRQGVDVGALKQAAEEVGKADAGCGRRIAHPVVTHIACLQLAKQVMSGGPIPSMAFAVSDDDLVVLRIGMVGALSRPDRAAEAARWIQRLRGLPEGSHEELDHLVDLLGDVRDWEPRLVLLRDMLDAGDQRDVTLTDLAGTLLELRRWPEAKAELKARLETRTGRERNDLLRAMVRMGSIAADPEARAWALLLEQPPAPRAERELRAHYEGGSLTIDPSVPPGEVQEHIMAAMIMGLGPEQAAILRDDLKEQDPELHARVLQLLPLAARPVSTAGAHLARATELFRESRYEEAIGQFQAALAIEPDLEYGRLGLGDSYYMTGRYELAIAQFRRSIAIRPTPQAWRFLGDAILRGPGQRQEARQCYEQALALDPDYQGAREMLRLVSGTP
ncbi:tetratricopeptide repeat protein [Nonomuraea sp. NPDC050663]|uniref:tetratricopeptide repeat protein n=1 Tax=Nonomuraea sp. NPDC050663 TaxID=3364370 RepID=UPI00378F5887